MITLIAVLGVLFCMALAALITWPIAFKYNNTLVVPVAMLVWFGLSFLFVTIYKDVIHTYFVGQKITYSEVCETVKNVELYWK